MKLKYYLRGIGIGVIVTAVLMGVSGRNAVNEAKADALKAYEQEKDALDNTTDETLPLDDFSESSDSSDAKTGEPVLIRDDNNNVDNNENNDNEGLAGIEQSLPQANGQDSVSDENSGDGAVIDENALSGEGVIVINPSGDADTTQNTDNNNEDGTEGIKIEVVSGDGSGTVARKLFNAGLVENASEYDAFLVQHGYDKKLTTGVKTIYAADSWQQIAEKLTTK